MVSAIQHENWPKPRNLKLQKAKYIKILFKKKTKQNPNWNIISILISVLALELILNLTLVLLAWKLEMLTKCCFPLKSTSLVSIST